MFKKRLKLFCILILLCMFSLSTFCFADNAIANDVVKQLGKDSPLLIANNPTANTNVKQGDQYLVGTSINVNYDVEGNVYILADTVTIDSKIIGNAFIATNNLNITENGYISHSLYAAANEITLDGIINDMYTVSNNLNFSGFANRDIHSASNSINLFGSIGRDAFISFQNINFSEKSTIFRNLDYSTEEEINIPNGLVEGNVNFVKAENINISFTFKINYVFLAVSFVATILVLWLVFKWFAPKFLENTSKLVSNNPFKTLGLGLLGLICIPIIAILLLVAQVTAILGFILIAIYIIFAVISSSVFVIAVNNWIAQKLKFDKAFKTFGLLIVTSIIAWALTFVPVAGGIFALIYVLTGFGIIIRNIISKKDKKIEIEE